MTSNPRTAPTTIVVMGVSGSGKSTVARALALRLDVAFVDADWFHSASNRSKMSSGVALDDDDRGPWLQSVGEQLRLKADAQRGSVTACSALKRAYRDVLRRYVAQTYFIFLDAPADVLRARLALRPVGLLPPALLASQLSDLEPLETDEFGARVDATLNLESIVDYVVTLMSTTSI